GNRSSSRTLSMIACVLMLARSCSIWVQLGLRRVHVKRGKHRQAGLPKTTPLIRPLALLAAAFSARLAGLFRQRWGRLRGDEHLRNRMRRPHARLRAIDCCLDLTKVPWLERQSAGGNPAIDLLRRTSPNDGGGDAGPAQRP